MDVQLLLLYLSPIFLAFIGWEMLYLRKHGADFPTATYQWRDLFANAALALMHQGGDALAAIAIAYLYDTLWGWRLFDIELNLWSVLLLFLLQDLCYWLVDQRAKMTRFPGFSASNFDHPGVCATIRSLDRRTWSVNHGNRVEDPAYASGGRPVHQRHR